MVKNNIKKCGICGCQIIRKKGVYAKDNIEGRSHATEHHCIAKRFFYGDNPIFHKNDWISEQDILEFCYECHEQLLHNPVLTREDIQLFAELVE